MLMNTPLMGVMGAAASVAALCGCPRPFEGAERAEIDDDALGGLSTARPA